MEIKIQKVCLRYNRNAINILNEVSLKFYDGMIYSIIGKNGSGKTTLLKMLCGELKSSSGKIIIDKMVYNSRSGREELEQLKDVLSYLPQIVEVKASSKTVLEELKLIPNFETNKMEEIFKVLNISLDVLDEEYSFLSNIMKRKIALSRVLIYNPSVIILDEPIIGLDNVAKKALINYLIKLKKVENKIIIVASNDIDFVNRISDEIVVLEEGNVIKLEKKSEIFRNVNFFDSHKIAVPKIIEFENLVLKEKNIFLGYRDEINDLIKDILRKS